jgi:DNA-binding transcriptional ArsR family regulator
MTRDLPQADLLLVNLGRGRDHAESIGSLAERLRMPHRATERALQAIADAGVHPLVADGSGVYLATSEAELTAYLGSLRHRALEIFRRYRGVKRARSAMRAAQYSQETLWPAA